MNIEQIAEQVARDFQMGFDGIELDFALEVARRAVAAEREACAIIGARTMEDMGRKAGGKIFADGQVIADAIRARSNAEVRGASRLAGEASSGEAATSTVVLGMRDEK